VITKPNVKLDDRDAALILKQLLARRLGYAPDWKPADLGLDAAIANIFSRSLYSIIQRLNQAPAKNKLAFLDLLNLSLVPATPARAVIVFQLAPDARDLQAQAGTQIAAPPPPNSTEQIVFETVESTGLTTAALTQVVSLWPGRDQYLDHSDGVAAGLPITLFDKPHLVDTPHVIYISHSPLLAISGSAVIEVEFELTQQSSEQLSVLWKYWDGAVWRAFRSATPACSEKDATNADSTNGFTQSGRYRLETDCAKSANLAVNGVDGYWIRAELTEPLVPDPAQALPLVDSIKLACIISNPLKGTLGAFIRDNQPFTQGPGVSRIHGVVTNEAGQPLQNVAVKITSPDDDNFEQVTLRTNLSIPAGGYDSTRDDGAGNITNIPSEPNYEIQVSFLTLDATYNLRNLDDDRDVNLDFAFNVEGLDPDKAFTDGTEIDLTKPFFPFGQQPQPGSIFYFSSKETFSKPGAKVQVYVARTSSPQDKLQITSDSSDPNPGGPLDHLIDWEYWNGDKWVVLFQSQAEFRNAFSTASFTTPTPIADLDRTEIIEFAVPRDIASTTVNDQDGLWMRARLVRGGFGFTQNVTWNDGTRNNEFTYVIDKPPSLAAFRIGYTWTYGRFHPDRVLTYNDFQYEDHTFEATWPGNAFLPFNRIADVTPTVYLGFDHRLPVDRIGLYVDIVEEPGTTEGPAMVYEYFDGGTWRELAVTDETRNLVLPGIVSFIAPEDSAPLARFGTELNWIRARLKEDGPPEESVVNAFFGNAVWASQRQTFSDTPLGTSTGLPNQILTYNQIPVLSERIEVRELNGARANVEWRLLVTSVTNGDRNAVRIFEEMLVAENAQTDIVWGDVRLRRDRNKQVIEAWVRWQEQPHFFYSGRDDRHYVIDRARGLVFFGDGTHGKIPPPGAEIDSRLHHSGGGARGNTAAKTIAQILGPLSGVEAAFNPRAAEGGADGEPLERFSDRAPKSIKHRGRAITPSDYETLALEASPAVAVARAIATRNASGQGLAGWVTLIVIPRSTEARPWPSFGLREEIREYIEDRSPADVSQSHQLYVTGPNYLPIGVDATIIPVIQSEAGTVEKRARVALEEFLHPLTGGPERNGWELGRDVYLSDVAAVLERVEGVDYVEDLALVLDKTPQVDQVRVGDDRVVASGKIRLSIKAGEE
jgi:uncharacterized phage protein gp47/JayE